VITTLSNRALNRATLARQLLLDRAALPAPVAIERLAGMQAQAPLAPYIGLWTRFGGFDPAELSDLVVDRAVVRTPLQRNTVHLVTARDVLAWHPLFAPLRAGAFRGHFPDGPPDPHAVAAHATVLLAERPRVRAELGRDLAAHWPGTAPATLADAAINHAALVQVPPRGLWGRTGQAAWAPLADWLGRAPEPHPSVEGLVSRYLAAFGPASVADAQTWSGLTRLREVFERLDLRIYRSENGQLLYDLPDAKLPDPDAVAPPRLLPAYDNLLLSHADRSRVIPDRRAVPLPPGNGTGSGSVLVDGMWAGTWTYRDERVFVDTFRRVPRADADALASEAHRLGRFLQTASSRQGVTR
jgi:hypothetical protein